jgi:hypothetical protein
LFNSLCAAFYLSSWLPLFLAASLLGCSIKAYHDQAVAAGIPALTTAGIYPGTSNVMAAHIVSISRGEYDESWNYKQPTPGECLGGYRGGMESYWLAYTIQLGKLNIGEAAALPQPTLGELK